MKKLFGLLGVLIIGLSGCSDADIEESNSEEVIIESNPLLEPSLLSDETLDDSDWGSLSALENESFTIEEMLIYALQDEYTAKAEYVYIMDTFDVLKPFSNIKSSEETHIALLLPLFEAYGIEVIDDESLDHLFEIDSLQEAYEIGVIAEINNIAMYELFLTQELPDDLREAFIKLRDASENHLAAFEKNAAKNVS